MNYLFSDSDLFGRKVQRQGIALWLRVASDLGWNPGSLWQWLCQGNQMSLTLCFIISKMGEMYGTGLVQLFYRLEEIMHRTRLACVGCRELGSPEAELETQIRGKVIYWEAIPGKARRAGREGS